MCRKNWGPEEYKKIELKFNKRDLIMNALIEKLKEIDIRRYKNPIRRWHIEMMLLAMMLVPIIVFFMWLQQATTILLDPQIVSKAIFAIAVGIFALVIWFLGISVIVVNLLREILLEILDYKKSQNLKNGPNR